FFFFQAEDGIRDLYVTGVQRVLFRSAMINSTSSAIGEVVAVTGRGLDIALVPGAAMGDAIDASDLVLSQAGTATVQAIGLGRPEIGRASWRERGWTAGGDGSSKKKAH